MSQPVLIESSIQFVEQIKQEFDTATVKNEPMLFNNDLVHAWDQGGPITKAFLHALPVDWQHSPLVIDSRVHMLMPGWYPCIPGWHHDDVPRTRSDGQPEYHEPTDRSEHIMMLVNSHLAPTEFAIGQGHFNVPSIGKVIYEEWHKEVDFLVNQLGLLSKVQAPDRTLICFNDRTWHQGVKAVENGWRFFIRASRYRDSMGRRIQRRNARTNEIRKQVQIYMGAENAGW